MPTSHRFVCFVNRDDGAAPVQSPPNFNLSECPVPGHEVNQNMETHEEIQLACHLVAWRSVPICRPVSRSVARPQFARHAS